MDKIRDIIGPGGKMIRSIVERTGCKIDVEDDGRVSIASVDEAAASKAIAIIEELTATAELNKTYLGKVVRVAEFGAFVEILPGTDGLLHVSEMAHHRVKDVRGARSRKATRSWSRWSTSTPRARSASRARPSSRRPGNRGRQRAAAPRAEAPPRREPRRDETRGGGRGRDRGGRGAPAAVTAIVRATGRLHDEAGHPAGLCAVVLLATASLVAQTPREVVATRARAGGRPS